MIEGYSVNEHGFHKFYDATSGLDISINSNTGTVNSTKDGEFYTKSLLEEDAAAIVEFMKAPGTGLGMLLIKLGRAFERAVTGGSSAT